MSILHLKNGNIVDEIVNAIVSGFRDDIVLEELADGLENETITKDQFTGAVDGLKLYIARFADSIKTISDAMEKFEFNDKQSIIKNRPLNLAQQVMQDVEGFKGAVSEFYSDDEDANGEEKPAPAKPAEKPVEKPVEKKPEASVNQEAEIKKPNVDEKDPKKVI